MTKTTIQIDGMSCGHCVQAVDRALRSVPGVQVDEVEIGGAVVTHDPTQASPAAIEAAIAEAGYTARIQGRGA